MSVENPRLLILGAHPDDAEYHAGGLATIYCQLGRTVKMISVTDGCAGHHQRPASELIPLRRQEAAAAGEVIGARYETWDFPDGQLLPSLDVRWRIVREVREFAPDLVLTHRTCDYHPDHRAVGQAVQDASYLVTVPGILPNVKALRRDPVVAHVTDLFTRPAALSGDIVIDVTRHVDAIVSMLACHQSQVFEWLPFEQGVLDQVPVDEQHRLAWLRTWYTEQVASRADRFRSELVATYGERRGRQIQYAEAYEISEYGRQPEEALRQILFPEAT